MNHLIAAYCLLSAFSLPAFADSFVYGNNATAGAPFVNKVDTTTGAIVDTYSNLSGINGRGVAVVGNTMYYTAVSSNSVFSYDLAAHTNQGSLFQVSPATSISALAYDGANLWIADLSGDGLSMTRNAFLYTPTGTLLRTITLSNCVNQCDGLEYFVKDGAGYLVANHQNAIGPYTLYDLNGKVLNPNFIPATGLTVGIAFDGTNFFTSEITDDFIPSTSLLEWDSNGNYIKTIPVTGPAALDDLSFDYAQVLTPTKPVPEPGTLLLIGTGSLGLVARLRKKLFSQ